MIVQFHPGRSGGRTAAITMRNCASENLEIPDNRCAVSGMTVEDLQRDHRSFSVERPASASITEMIQNRITTCGSVQPFCSKW